ncbi:MAG TPA: protoporphyrinogen oxidase [Blastocatellia bacterium]|nr:protoporphyrinogen oxidase [Blastocatellia bacterium]
MSDHQKDVVVIGAGISGLTCAYRLKASGLDVALLEASAQVGGVIRSESVDGYLIERGPNSTQGIVELLMLVSELGLDDELIEGDPKAPAFIYYNKQLHPVPDGPGALIKSKLLSAGAKLRLLGEPFAKKREGESEESVGSFVERRLGREVAERLVAPFVSGIYAGDDRKISVQAAFPSLSDLERGHGSLFRGGLARAREAKAKKAGEDQAGKTERPKRKRLCSFRDGLATLPRALAARIGEDLMRECRGISISNDNRLAGGRGLSVSFERGGYREQIRCAHIVVAAPAKAASGLVSPLSGELAALLSEIEYAPMAIAYLSYDTASVRHSLNGFGFLAVPSERLSFLGCLFNSSLFAGRAPSGRALLTAFAGGSRNPGIVAVPDDELVSKIHGELQAILGVTGDPKVISITRWARAIPQYALGHAERVKRIDRLTEGIGGLSLAGNYLHGVSVGDCVKEADRKARGIVSELRGGQG